MSTSRTLKDALYENLLAALSPDSMVRRNAEEQLTVFEVTNEYGIHLAEIALDPNLNWPIRQLALVLLRQHIDVHWSAQLQTFQEPEISKDAKLKIRNMLLNALGQPSLSHTDDLSSEKRMRSSIAIAISSIVHVDWPEEWPELFDVLLGYLISQNIGAINGALKVFIETCQEVVDSQISTIAPLLLPKMYNIFIDSRNFSTGIRERAVRIFSIIIETIAIIGEDNEVSIKLYLDPVLPQFVDALIRILQTPDDSKVVDIALKRTVLNGFTLLVKNFRKKIWKWMPSILSPVWYSLISCASFYVRDVVNSDALQNQIVDQQCDSDGEILNLDNLIFAVFDFFLVLIETPRSRKLMKKEITVLLYYTIKYMQITDEQMHSWSSDPDRFVEDEDDDSYTYSVRLSALDILISLMKEYEYNESKEENIAFQTSLIETVKKHLMESNQLKMNPENYFWWKPQEACLLALGSVANSLIETLKTNSSLSNDIKAVLDHFFSINTDVSPFFSGRSLWAASIFAPILSHAVIDRFLQATRNGLMSHSTVIKISALRSIFNLCTHLSENNQVDLIKPYLPQIMDATVAIGTQYSTQVLGLVLQTIKILISIDKSFAAEVENKVSSLSIATFLRYSFDPVLISNTGDIFKELSKNEFCQGLLQQKLIPTLVSILNPAQMDQTVQTLQPVAIDILTTIVRNSTKPLSQALVDQCFTAAAKCILSTKDDNSTLQNGGECIRSFISKSIEQIARYRDPESGKDGMFIVMQVCLHLLDPRMNESCAAFVGKLIFITIIKGSPYLGNDNIHLLLRSVLSKLQTSETLTVTQSLIMVFAHLINHNLPTVLDFLSSLPGPSGSQTALEFVLNQWLSRQHLFYGHYDNKVSIMALCKLLENSIVNSDQDSRLNLNLIRVPGDPIFVDTPEIKTRSKTQGKSEKWTVVPCSVKILKLLLNELDWVGSIDDLTENDYDEEDEEDEEKEIDEVEKENQSNCDMNSEFDDIDTRENCKEDLDDIIDTIESCKEELDNIIDTIEGCEEELDEDFLNDPISKINLGEHLTGFVRSFIKTPHATEFTSHLSEKEKSLLAKIGCNGKFSEKMNCSNDL